MAQYSALFTLGLLCPERRSPDLDSNDTVDSPILPSSHTSFLTLDTVSRRDDRHLAVPSSSSQTAPSPTYSYLSLSSDSSARSRSRSRSRRPSHENLPTMKPAPSTSLPAPPSPPIASDPPRKLSLPTSPTSFAATPTHRPTQSVSSGLTAATSVRTVRKQTAYRTDALAHLEGRGVYKLRRRNFMSLSDDEDEDDAEDEKPKLSASLDEKSTRPVEERDTARAHHRRGTVSVILSPLPTSTSPPRRARRSSVASLLSSAGSRRAATWLASFLDLDLRAA